jgi:hypothetical protein
VLIDVTEIREKIESTVVQDSRDAAEKANLLRDAELMTRKLRLAGDAVVGAALAAGVPEVMPRWFRRPGRQPPYRRLAPDRRDRQGRPRVTGRAPEPGQARSADLGSYLLRNLDISWRGRVGKNEQLNHEGRHGIQDL